MKLFDTVASWATLGHMEELQVVSEDMLAISRIYEKVISSMHMGDILLDCFNFNSSNMVATFVKEEGFENFVKSPHHAWAYLDLKAQSLLLLVLY
mgnify:CR=1 FL=1